MVLVRPELRALAATNLQHDGTLPADVLLRSEALIEEAERLHRNGVTKRLQPLVNAGFDMDRADLGHGAVVSATTQNPCSLPCVGPFVWIVPHLKKRSVRSENLYSVFECHCMSPASAAAVHLAK